MLFSRILQQQYRYIPDPAVAEIQTRFEFNQAAVVATSGVASPELSMCDLVDIDMYHYASSDFYSNRTAIVGSSRSTISHSKKTSDDSSGPDATEDIDL